MRKVLLFAGLLMTGLLLSQVLPLAVPGVARAAAPFVQILTMVGLSFIMIRVGHEFEVDRRHPRAYAKDYLVAMSAAALPWILVTLYFVFVLLPSASALRWDAWRETLLAGRFAAPTSAGVLFTMLAAAGLAATWVFRKARVLAIFDDIDTVLLMIPLKMLIVGIAWQLGAVVLLMGLLIVAAWRYLHSVRLPSTWPWIMAYAIGIVAITEMIYAGSKLVDPKLPIHFEVLLPAFALGCVLRRPRRGETPSDERAANVVSAAFMVLVGLSLPPLLATTSLGSSSTYTASQPMLSPAMIAAHVLAVTALSNLGKMMPLFMYRREASLRERLAVSVAMWPRGEVGAGVIVVSLGYGIGGPVLTVAVLSLALNLVLTGAFILLVRRLIKPTRVVIPAHLRAHASAQKLRDRRGPAWGA